MISSEVLSAVSDVLKYEGPRALQDPYRLELTLKARVPTDMASEVESLCQVLRTPIGQQFVDAAKVEQVDLTEWGARIAADNPKLSEDQAVSLAESLRQALSLSVPEPPPVLLPTVPTDLLTEPLVQPISGASAVVQIAFSPDASVWAIGDSGMNISLMNYGGPVWSISVATEDPKVASMQRIRKFAFDPSGHVLMVALADRLVALDSRSGVELWSYSPKRLFSFLVQGPSDVLFLDAERMLVPFDDGSLSIWNLSGFSEWRRRRSVGPRYIAALSNDRFAGTDGSQTFVWQMPAFEPGYRPLSERVYGLASLRTSPVIACRTLEQLQIIDIDREARLAMIETDYGLPLVAASPTADIFALGCERSVVLIDPTGNELASHPISSDARLTSLAFSPDGRLLALGSFDGQLTLLKISARTSEVS